MKSKRAVVAATALFALLAGVATAAVSASAAKNPPKLPWAAPAVPVGSSPLGVGVVQATNTDLRREPVRQHGLGHRRGHV